MQIPPSLRPGDRIGLVAPASRIDIDQLQPALAQLNAWGLRVELGQTLTSQFHQFAGTDSQRAADLQHFLDDPGIRAVLAVRGGYGSSRLLDGLDFTSFLAHPKWVVGFSDITALHNHLTRLGVESLHAAMPKTFNLDPTGYSVETLRQALFGEPLAYSLPAHALNRTGTGTGPLTGGNLCLLCHLIGSASEVDTAGKILFLEDVNEYLHAVDRFVVQLKRAGKLAHLAGLIVGDFSDLKDNAAPPFGATAYELIGEHVAPYSYPVCVQFPTGHEPANWALICGREARLHVTETEVRLSMASVKPTPS